VKLPRDLAAADLEKALRILLADIDAVEQRALAKLPSVVLSERYESA